MWRPGAVLSYCSGVLHSMQKEMATHSPVFLPGESHGQKNLTGYSLWGRKSQMRLSDDTTTTTIRIGEGNATHCRILVWRIPWTEEPGRLQSMGSQRVGHDRVTNTYTDAHTAFEFLFVCFGCAGSLLLVRLFSSCSEWGLLSVTVHGLLIAVASPVAEHGL